MLKVYKKSHKTLVIDILPIAVAEEILRLCRGRRGGLDALREIRLRAEGRCSVLIGRERLPLFSTLTADETDKLVETLACGALYAYRDSIASGYLTLPGGVRVGLCGYARYDGERLVGVSEMRSLVFRIPTGECEFADELLSVYLSSVKAGMLIYSPPGVGKTTALRSLAASLGGGTHPRRVAVVDERCEFDAEDYRGCEVDILKGYKRRRGIEIATRTMSPDLIMIDEIGADDAEAILDVVRCGIPLVATAHASDRDELFSKSSLKELFACGAFDCLVGIFSTGDGYFLRVDKL